MRISDWSSDVCSSDLLEQDYAVADAPVEAGDADDAAIDALSAGSLTLEALPADETDTGTPVDDAAASESGEIDEITFDGFDIDDDGASLVVDVPDDAGATASTGGIELVDVDALLASADSLETAAASLTSPPAAHPSTHINELEHRVCRLSFADL